MSFFLNNPNSNIQILYYMEIFIAEFCIYFWAFRPLKVKVIITRSVGELDEVIVKWRALAVSYHIGAQ